MSITELSQQSTDFYFSDRYYRNLIDQVLSDAEQYSVLKLQDAVGQSKDKIANMCDCQTSRKTSMSYNCKTKAVRSMLDSLSSTSCQTIKDWVQEELTSLVKAVEKSVNNNLKPLLSKLDELKNNIANKLQEVGNEYLQKLEEELKDKVETEQKINTVLNILNNLHNEVNQ